MTPFPLKGAEFPNYACGVLCAYEGDGTLPRILSEDEQRGDFSSRAKALHNPNLGVHAKQAKEGKFWVPPSFWMSKPEDLIEVTYRVMFSERGKPEKPSTWQVNLSAIHDIDLPVILDTVMNLNPNRRRPIGVGTTGPSGWMREFREFLTANIRELFAVVPDSNLKGLSRIVKDVAMKERKAWH